MLSRLLSVSIAVLSAFTLSAQNFYDLGTIQKIEIQFSQTNWDYMMDTAKAGSEGYIIAQWVKINGVQFDSCGVKYKGNSSYNANQNKNPLHIELDYVRNNQNYQNYTDLKLSNGFSDPSFIREVLSFDMLSNYMDCPKSNFAQVYINNQYYGVYANTESINKKFVGDHFYSSGNTLVKCNPDTPGPNSTSNLVHLGNDSTFYYSYYEIKSDWGWIDLMRLIDTLAYNSTALDSILDIDRAIWMLAFNNVLVNLDSYTGAFSQNYYLYMDNNGRFDPVIWDLNMCFGGFQMTGAGPPLSLTQMQQLSPTLHSNNAQRPLIQKILAVPMYKRMYIAHMRTITSEMLAGGYYSTQAQTLRTTIDTAVASDPYKLYTYTQFQNAMTTSVQAGPMNIPGLTTLVNGRVTYLQSTTEFQYTPPTITAVTNSPASPAFNGTVAITANVTNANTVYLGYRYYTADRFYRIPMYDDGNHNDGAANDNVYGASLPVNSAMIEYYIYADNSNAGMFSPERAEHEFYTIVATVQMASVGELVINELMSVNTSTVTDPNGQYSDWIELYNNTANPISLGTLYMTDDFAVPYKWAFPVNAVIAPNSYYIIWADEDTTQNGVHCNFKLAASGEFLMLSYANGNILDSLTFPALNANTTWGRYPNGTGPFTGLFPTFNAVNSLTSVSENMTATSFSMYPNPANDQVMLTSSANITRVEIFSSTGQLIDMFNNNSTSVMIDTSNLTSGIYFIRINEGKPEKLMITH